MKIAFTNPEAELIRVGKARLASAVWKAEAPAVMPERFIRVDAAGGPGRNLGLSQRLVQVHAYASTRAQTAVLLEEALTALVDAGRDPGETRIRDVTIAGEPSSNPDPDLPTRTRYSATVGVLLRGSTL